MEKDPFKQVDQQRQSESGEQTRLPANPFESSATFREKDRIRQRMRRWYERRRRLAYSRFTRILLARPQEKLNSNAALNSMGRFLIEEAAATSSSDTKARRNRRAVLAERWRQFTRVAFPGRWLG